MHLLCLWFGKFAIVKLPVSHRLIHFNAIPIKISEVIFKVCINQQVDSKIFQFIFNK